MSSESNTSWREELGIGTADGKTFVSSKAELNFVGADAPQGHILRRAFDLLKLDGVLSAENAPLVYFKVVEAIDRIDIVGLHRTFWNHGGAPILVVITPREVHVYSGLVRPAPDANSDRRIPGLVETIARASSSLREFLPTVQSGEFFRRHQRSFNPAHRVDRDLLGNLQATRDKLVAVSPGRLDARVLDALLCRLVFACYLFDRNVVGEPYLAAIGLRKAHHLRDVLGLQPRSKAKKHLYDLFQKLGEDFNGDLFSDDLSAEAKAVLPAHLEPLDDFFRATDVRTGQASFWPYDFAAIPIETISAIYERFLEGTAKGEGAFYTPRFLAELVLDVALSSRSSLLDARYLDPACGSGIFLVGIFNRVAEEWKRANPGARNDRRARELRKVLCSNLCGVDINPTACKITAFSLYLAYLDQLSPRDIQELQQNGHKLPRLVHYPEQGNFERIEGNIWCGDFFAEDAGYPSDASVVVGNPPWGSTVVAGTPVETWCRNSAHSSPVPDRQIATAFLWKAARHVTTGGRICFVLPHGTLFNHSAKALEFQRAFFKSHAVDHVLNLADYQRFLFEEAGHPALVVAYRKGPPTGPQHPIEYWAPKADWLITRAEIIAIMPEDRSTISVAEVLSDLEREDAPQVWKKHYWATARDWRLIDRLSLYPRLRDHVGRVRAKGTKKPWLMAEGFQPPSENDGLAAAKTIRLPSKLFVEATSPQIDLFLLRENCTTLQSADVKVRRGSKETTAVFRAPHVLVSKGFTSIAFADFDVSFRHALRGISGPESDRDLLTFLAAYLRSPLARYFLFHTSSNWGVSRQEVHVDEVLRLPFGLPDDMPAPRRARGIVKNVAATVAAAAAKAAAPFADRSTLVREASAVVEPLIDEYFDILPSERVLIDDTVRITIPSVRPTRSRIAVPTIEPSRPAQRQKYTDYLCQTLNGWAGNGPFSVRGHALASNELGIGLAILHKTLSGSAPAAAGESANDLLTALSHLQDATVIDLNGVRLLRGTKVFDRERLYVVKPIGQRFWTQTAALNDADEIAGTILMRPSEDMAWP